MDGVKGIVLKYKQRTNNMTGMCTDLTCNCECLGKGEEGSGGRTWPLQKKMLKNPSKGLVTG